VEPVLGGEDTGVDLGKDRERVLEIVSGLEGVLIIVESASVKEGGSDVDNGLARSEDGAGDLRNKGG
jgi:hypothetical protein